MSHSWPVIANKIWKRSNQTILKISHSTGWKQRL